MQKNENLFGEQQDDLADFDAWDQILRTVSGEFVLLRAKVIRQIKESPVTASSESLARLAFTAVILTAIEQDILDAIIRVKDDAD